MFVQTFGDLVNFNPHLHVLAADGAFLPNGRFVALPRVPDRLLAEGFRRAVPDFLVKNEALSEELRCHMLAWRHGGFSAHNEVSVAADRARGERAKEAFLPAGVALPSPGEELATEFAARARAVWARLIRKVYEADPLECPRCTGPMRVISLIEDPGVIRHILEHLGWWAPLAVERSPPLSPASWPRHANLPLTYHPVPDIA